MQLGIKLRRLRQIHAYTQEEVSFFCDISQAAYCKYESGKSLPNIIRIELLANLYELKISDIFDLSVEQLTAKVDKNKVRETEV